MTAMLFPSINGSAKGAVNGSAKGLSHSSPSQTPSPSQAPPSVQEFFSRFNWSDRSLEVQENQGSSATEEDSASHSMRTVNQFLNGIDWEGSSMTSQGEQPSDPSPNLSNPLSPAASNDGFTLDDFSDLF